MQKMNDKEKKLILKDICGRLPYGVFVKATGPNAREDAIYDICKVDIEHEFVTCTILVPNIDQSEGHITKFKGLDSDIKFGFDIRQVRPILRPMEDMSPEELEEYHRILTLDVVLEKSSPEILIDFFHEHGLDYRGLLKKGLAVNIVYNSNP